MQTIVRIGTRGSQLATTQTAWAVAQLRAANPHVDFRTVIIETTGDRQRNVPFSAVGTKGMFVKEIELALIGGQIDVGIHSLKDMPGAIHAALDICCVPKREDPYDAFISNDFGSLDDLKSSSLVGTSSARRGAQLRAYRPDLNIVELRGNLDTRLRKLDEGHYDAIIVACAGLHRLGLSHRITARLPKEVCLPAVGQGALALESRKEDIEIRALMNSINDADSADCVMAERALLAALGGGCSVPIAAFAEVNNNEIQLNALVASLDGGTVLRVTASGHRVRPELVGAEAAQKLIDQNAESLLGSHSEIQTTLRDEL